MSRNKGATRKHRPVERENSEQWLPSPFVGPFTVHSLRSINRIFKKKRPEIQSIFSPNVKRKQCTNKCSNTDAVLMAFNFSDCTSILTHIDSYTILFCFDKKLNAFPCHEKSNVWNIINGRENKNTKIVIAKMEK